MDTSRFCYDLFVDGNGSLYCAEAQNHRIIKNQGNTSSQTIIIAGNGTFGLASNQLFFPMGIFVDANFNLYVADRANQRVQRFSSGNPNAVTIVGQGSSQSIILQCPNDVVVDGDGYVFVVDLCKHCIVADGPNRFWCIVGCSGTNGAASNQLANPAQMGFDRDGNIYVTDYVNHRVQKFFRATPNDCCKTFIGHLPSSWNRSRSTLFLPLIFSCTLNDSKTGLWTSF